MKSISFVLVAATVACVVLLTVSLAAASTPAVKPSLNTPANQQKAWPAETLTGKIMMVDPALKLVVVKTPDGVPFDMVVTPRTRIESGAHALALQDISQDLNKNVSVRFRPEGRGDVARSIQING